MNVAWLLLPVVFAEEPAVSATLSETIHTFIPTLIPKRSGPYNQDIGGFSVRHLRINAALAPETLRVTEVAPQRLAVEGTLRLRANLQKYPFEIALDLSIWQGTCEGWVTAMNVPMAFELQFKRDASDRIRVVPEAANPVLSGLPLAEHLTTCLSSSLTSPLVSAGLMWAGSHEERLTQTVTTHIETYMRALDPAVARQLVP
jgi:hypothetical protein